MPTWFLLFQSEIKIIFSIPFSDGNMVLFLYRTGITLLFHYRTGIKPQFTWAKRIWLWILQMGCFFILTLTLDQESPLHSQYGQCFSLIKILFLILFWDGNLVLFLDQMGITLVIPWPDGNQASVHMGQGNMTVNFKTGLFLYFNLDIGSGECLAIIFGHIYIYIHFICGLMSGTYVHTLHH